MKSGMDKTSANAVAGCSVGVSHLVFLEKHAAAWKPRIRQLQAGRGRTWSEACQHRGESPPHALVRFPLA